MSILAHTSEAPAEVAYIGTLANHTAASQLFADFKDRRAASTNRSHAAALAHFGRFLTTQGLPTTDLHNTPDAWHGITWGLVSNFRDHMKTTGYAPATINNRLAAVRAYARLATAAGAIAPAELILIDGVAGYSYKEAIRIEKNCLCACCSSMA